MIGKAIALVRAWLLIDFFGDTRRTGQPGSTLTSAIFTQSFVALVLAALVFEPSLGVVPYAAANLSLSTLLIGVGALAEPENVERRLADQVLVGTAPVPRALLPLARLLHGGFHLGLVTVGTAIPPAVLCGFVGGSWVTVFAYLAVAVVLAGVVSGVLALLVRAVARLGGATRAALVAGTIRALLLGGGLIAFALCLPHLDETVDALPGGRAAALAWPPYWGARWLAAPWTDAGYGVALAAAGAALFGLSVALGEAEDEGRGARVRDRRGGPLRAIERRLARRGPLLGTTVWTSTMLFRSPGFRARVLPLFGIPLAMVLLAFAEPGADERRLLVGVTLQLPAIYLPFLVAFLPHADHEGAGWLFETSPADSRALARESALLSLSIRVLLPLHVAVGAGVALLGFGTALAVGLAAFSWGLSVLVGVFAVRRLEHVPFTSGADEPPALEFGGLVGLALVLAGLGGAFATVAGSPAGVVAGCCVAIAAFVHLGRAPRRLAAST